MAMRSSSRSKGDAKIHKVMKEYKEGTLHSGSGPKVKSRKQAVAIAMSEARKAGARLPRKKASTTKKTSVRKKTSKRMSGSSS